MFPDVVSGLAQCSDHVHAAKAGHVDCLKELAAAGRFLPLDTGRALRERAGEARKLQAWEVAICACAAGRAPVLAWVIRRGWNFSIDTNTSWHVQDAMPQWVQALLDAAQTISKVTPTLDIPLSEVAVFRAVIRSPTTECLGVLLGAGCRSAWLCTLAVLEGRQDCLDAAVAAGCPVTKDALIAAAHCGHPQLLRFVCSQLKTKRPHTCRSWEQPALSELVEDALRAALEGGHVSCVKILLKATRLYCKAALKEICEFAMTSAARMGQLECLKAAHWCALCSRSITCKVEHMHVVFFLQAAVHSELVSHDGLLFSSISNALSCLARRGDAQGGETWGRCGGCLRSCRPPPRGSLRLQCARPLLWGTHSNACALPGGADTKSVTFRSRWPLNTRRTVVCFSVTATLC